MSKAADIFQGDEKGNATEKSSQHSAESLKLDKHGLPLVPQPSRFNDDPLVSVGIKLISSTLTIYDRTGLDG